MIPLLILTFSLHTVQSDFGSAPKVADFSVQEQPNDITKSTTIALEVTQLPHTLHDSARWIVQRAIMSQLYPAQNTIWKNLSHYFQTNYLDQERIKTAENFQAQGYNVHHIILEKNHVRYSALLLTHSEPDNGQWVLQATGNGEPIEWAASRYAPHYLKAGYNVLLVNGPGVGRSEGTATAKTIGEAQLLGLTFLEENIGARKIVLAGFSLGGAAIGQAVLHHDFDTSKRDYLVIRQMTFDRVSTIFENYADDLFPSLKPFCKPFIAWAGCEMDSVDASRKLQTLNIPETIIQAGTDIGFEDDGVIPAKATLAYHLTQEGLTGPTKQFYTVPNSAHIFPAEQTIAAIQEWEERSGTGSNRHQT